MTENQAIGARIRALREARSQTREELAAAAGMPAGRLEAMERGDVFPSLAPVLKIARALGVRAGTFLDDHPASDPVVCRGGNALGEVRFSGNPAGISAALDFRALAANRCDRHMEPFLVDVSPAAEAPSPSAHEGEEFLYVLAGSVEISYGCERHVLHAGDSIYYDSVIPHHVHTAGPHAARILAVVFTPA